MSIKEVKAQVRERSTIAFPYSDLETAIKVASTIQEKAGLECATEQLAAWMGVAANGGTFRSRYSAARLFGLITTERGGRVALTGAGRSILDPAKSAKAKATAFQRIELYEKIYETLKGHALPPKRALERMIVNLGVTQKQADRARQAFVKSAKVANFLDSESGTFIAPGFPEVQDVNNPEVAPVVPEDKSGKQGLNGELLPDLDPIILGLIHRLPATGDVWPMRHRKQWLELMAGTFNLVYEDEDGQNNSE